MRFSPLLVGVAFFALLCPGDARQEKAKEKLTPETALATMREVNMSVRATYANARRRILADAGPVIIYNDESVIFRYGDTRRATKVLPVIYHDLKTIGHVVMGMHNLLFDRKDTEVTPALAFEIKRYLELIETARGAIAHRELSRDQLARQYRLLDGCKKYLTSVLEDRRIDGKLLVSTVRSLKDSLQENSYEAAKGQLDTLHKEMMAIKAKLSKKEWKSLVVIIPGFQQPRKDNLATQYFARLLGEPGECKRIIYAEGIFDEAKMLELLGTKLLDVPIGTDFFNDSEYMFRDLLAEVAKRGIDEIFAKE
jgi:hypothetical protein